MTKLFIKYRENNNMWQPRSFSLVMLGLCLGKEAAGFGGTGGCCVLGATGRSGRSGQANLEAKTRNELTTLEAKNRSLSHQLVLLQQQDEAQVQIKSLMVICRFLIAGRQGGYLGWSCAFEIFWLFFDVWSHCDSMIRRGPLGLQAEVLRHKATARALQKELDQVAALTATATCSISLRGDVSAICVWYFHAAWSKKPYMSPDILYYCALQDGHGSIWHWWVFESDHGRWSQREPNFSIKLPEVPLRWRCWAGTWWEVTERLIPC